MTEAEKMTERSKVFMLRLREALEASWDTGTSYQAVEQTSNRPLGQCYPTARVVQHFFPESEIIEGKVWTGKREELHFWNGLLVGKVWYHIDLTWQQFPAGSLVQDFAVLSRETLVDSDETVQRCTTLLQRVKALLAQCPDLSGA
jgi:hypothetical protein